MADKHMISMVAGTGIKPSTIVRTSPEADFNVHPCTNNIGDVPFGVAQNWLEIPGGAPGETVYAASAGKKIMVWAPGATAVAAVQLEGQYIPSGSLVGPNVNSELILVAAGWAVGYLLESTSPTYRWRLRVYVHPMRLTSGSTS